MRNGEATMMKQFVTAVAGVAVGVASLLAVAQTATAQVSFPKKALGISDGTFMVRAMDDCNSATTTVVSPGSPSAGCVQANGGTTDDTLNLKFMRLRVTKKARIYMFANGLTLGDELRVRLTLRITKTGVQTTGGPATVTFPDVVVDCPKAPDAFNVRPNGAIVGTTSLSACLAPNSELVGTGSNVEVLDAAVINIQTGKVLAVPGILR
jgi:hypothetical protein